MIFSREIEKSFRRTRNEDQGPRIFFQKGFSLIEFLGPPSSFLGQTL